MLRKLIGYDFRCTWKWILTMFATSTVAALLSMTCSLLNYYSPLEPGSIVYVLVSVGLSLGESLLQMLSYLASMGTILLSAIHYYKKMISDEAYLTFTLPATPGQHLISKLVTGTVWSLVSYVVLFINFIILSIPDAIRDLDATQNGGMDQYPDSSLEFLASPAIVGIVIGVILLLVVLLITQLALVYLALTIGGVIANKHKAIAGIALYWVSNSVVSGIMMFTAIIASAIVASLLPLSDEWMIAVILYLCTAVITGFGLLYYFINRKLLTNNLNLP